MIHYCYDQHTIKIVPTLVLVSLYNITVVTYSFLMEQEANSCGEIFSYDQLDYLSLTHTD